MSQNTDRIAVPEGSAYIYSNGRPIGEFLKLMDGDKAELATRLAVLLILAEEDYPGLIANTLNSLSLVMNGRSMHRTFRGDLLDLDRYQRKLLDILKSDALADKAESLFD